MITVVGSSNIDFITYTDKLPKPGETVTGNEFKVTAGGKGANQAAAAARLGVETNMLGKIGGKDRYADLLMDGFKWAGVETKYIAVEEDTYCGTAVILVDKNAQNCVTIIAHANGLMDREYLDKHRELIAASKIVVVEFGIPLETAEYAAALARKEGALTIVNPAPAKPMSDRFYRLSDILVPNETETELLSGVFPGNADSKKKAADFFHSKGVENVVITLGEGGVYLSGEKEAADFPICCVEAVETTGAGDSFVGALAAGLHQDRPLHDAISYACVAAAVSVTSKGTLYSMPAKDEVEAYLTSQFRSIE